jgi:uracil-DNA glycosylase
VLVGCGQCPRLKDFRQANRKLFKGWHEPVPSFGSLDASLLIVGLAPGLQGANKTGRPFTGDYAGILLYETLVKKGFALGMYQAHVDDDLFLVDTRITNAVRCVPPNNKPTPLEIQTCGRFLLDEINMMPNLKVILSLGQISFNSVVKTHGLKASNAKFGHGMVLSLPSGVFLVGSYHCSRYNTSTGRLTPQMFHAVVDVCTKLLRG